MGLIRFHRSVMDLACDFREIMISHGNPFGFNGFVVGVNGSPIGLLCGSRPALPWVPTEASWESDRRRMGALKDPSDTGGPCRTIGRVQTHASPNLHRGGASTSLKAQTA